MPTNNDPQQPIATSVDTGRNAFEDAIKIPGHSFVSAAGDLNGDGCADFALIQASAFAYLNSYSQGVSLVFGGSTFSSGQLTAENSIQLPTAPSISSLTINYQGPMIALAGDVNHDGLSDIVIGGSPRYNCRPSIDIQGCLLQQYLLFGNQDPQSFINNLGSETVSLFDDFYHSSDSTGFAGNLLNPSSSKGDINGDGFDDIVIASAEEIVSVLSSPFRYYDKVFVVFGKNGNWSNQQHFSPSTLNGTTGFMITLPYQDKDGLVFGAHGDVFPKWCSLDDFNGDNYSDLLIGMNGRSTAYIIFGHSGDWPASLDVSQLTGSNGFVINFPFQIKSVASAGDFNGDGNSDFIICKEKNGVINYDDTECYVIFGRNGVWPASTDINDLFQLKNIGFKLIGPSGLGASLAANDFNQDGMDDLIIGAPNIEPTQGHSSNGQVYVLFGSNRPFIVPLVNLSFEFDGMMHINATGDYTFNLYNLGLSVAALGDINNDTYPDIAFTSNTDAYIVLGQASFSLMSNQLVLTNGESVVFDSNSLSIEPPLNEVIFKISDIEHGQFHLAVDATAITTEFTYQQILSNEIVFSHDGSNLPPSYTLNANLRRANIFNQIGNILFLPAPSFSINQYAEETIFAPTNLSITNTFSSNQIMYRVDEVQAGEFVLNGNISQPIYEFSQQDIEEGNVIFIQNNTAASSPSFNIAVSNNISTTSSINCMIDFNHAPIFITNTITVNNQGGTITLGIDNIFAYDQDDGIISLFGSSEDNIVFTAINPSNCYFQFLSNPGITINSFDKISIGHDLVQFVYGNIINKQFVTPSFSLVATDNQGATSLVNNASVILNLNPLRTTISNFLTTPNPAITTSSFFNNSNSSSNNVSSNAVNLTMIVGIVASVSGVLAALLVLFLIARYCYRSSRDANLFPTTDTREADLHMANQAMLRRDTTITFQENSNEEFESKNLQRVSHFATTFGFDETDEANEIGEIQTKEAQDDTSSQDLNREKNSPSPVSFWVNASGVGPNLSEQKDENLDQSKQIGTSKI